jgi:hypothetical protein
VTHDNETSNELLPPGKYTAEAVRAYYNEAKTGTTWVQVAFRVTEGDWQGHEVEWSGYLNEKNMGRTFEALLLLGFQGDDVFEFIDNCPTTAPNKVQIVTEHDTYNGNTKAKVRFINQLGKFVPAGEREALKVQMKAAMAEARARLGIPAPSRPIGGGSGAKSTAHTSSKDSKQPYQPKPPANPDADFDSDIPF